MQIIAPAGAIARGTDNDSQSVRLGLTISDGDLRSLVLDLIRSELGYVPHRVRILVAHADGRALAGAVVRNGADALRVGARPGRRGPRGCGVRGPVLRPVRDPRGPAPEALT